jgi:predicted dehydrogenase
MDSPLSRRSFVGRGLSAAALGAGTTLLNRAESARADDKAASPDPKSSINADAANNKLVLAVMGTNGRGTALASGFTKQSGAEVEWIIDVDDEAAAKGAAAVVSAGGREPQVARDFRRALDDKSVDALVIAAPDHWHAAATILACAAGKHVYCEKPACHNPREGEWMVEAARKHKRVVQLGTQRRSSPEIRAAIDRLHRGEIGQVRFARGWITSTRPNIGRGQETAPPAKLDYALWQGPAPERHYRDNLIHYNWHWFWNWGTGELGNNGIHALDVCRWGLQADAPERVTCGGGKLFFDDDQETPDTQLATFDFGNRSIAWEHRTWNRRGLEGESFGIAFYGDQGAIVIGNRDYQVYDMAGAKRDATPITNGESEHLVDFLDCIRNGDRPRADIEEGVKSTLLCHLGNIAYRTGRAVYLDTSSVKIRDDAEQQELWQRDYATGWQPQV